MCIIRYFSSLCFVLLTVLIFSTTSTAEQDTSFSEDKRKATIDTKFCSKDEKSPKLINSYAVNKHILDYDVIIDIGHGGVDGGTSYGNVLEKQLNLAIGAKLYHQLKEKGYRVGVTRLHDYALSDDNSYSIIRSRHLKDLNQRRMIAESLKPKVFISIHINFSPNPFTKGPIILHQKQGESYLLAELLQEELNQQSQSEQRSRQSNQFYLLQNISQPCLIAEVGFISHSGERQKLQEASYQEQIATRMAVAIDRFFILYP